MRVLHFNSELPFLVSSNMIELSVVEAAVQECSQSVDETMYVGKMDIFLWRVTQCLPSWETISDQ